MFKIWILAILLQTSPDGKMAQFQSLAGFETQKECESTVRKIKEAGQDVADLVCIGALPAITSI